MNISLPDDMKDFVEAEVRARGFMSASEYIRDLIRQQRDVADLRARLEAADPVPVAQFDKPFFDRLQAKVDQAR